MVELDRASGRLELSGRQQGAQGRQLERVADEPGLQAVRDQADRREARELSCDVSPADAPAVRGAHRQGEIDELRHVLSPRVRVCNG